MKTFRFSIVCSVLVNFLLMISLSEASVDKLLFSEKILNNTKPVEYFIEHNNPINSLSFLLSEYGKASLVGFSGTGKTQIAKMYSYQNQDKYDLVWFIDCNLDIDEEFVKLAKYINGVEKKVVFVEDSLGSKQEIIAYLTDKKNWLLVFDNLKIGTNSKVLEFVNWNNKGNIIFASQDHESLPNIVSSIMLDFDQSLALAKITLNQDKQMFAELIATKYSAHPISIVLLSQAINQKHGVGIVKYKSIIENGSSAIKLAMVMLRKHLSDEASELMSKIAFIDNQGFSLDFLKVIFAKDLDKAIKELLNFDVISCKDKSNPDNPIYDMHDVITEDIKSTKLDARHKVGDIAEAITNYYLALRSNDDYLSHKFRNAPTMQENIKIVLLNASVHGANLYKVLALRRVLFGSIITSQDIVKSTEMVNWFMRHEKAGNFRGLFITDKDKYHHARYLDTIGRHYQRLIGDLDLGIVYYDKAQKILEKLSGYNNVKLVDTLHQAELKFYKGIFDSYMTNSGKVRVYGGDYYIGLVEKAIGTRYHDKNKAVFSKLLYTKAIKEFIIGNYEGALQYLEQSLDIRTNLIKITKNDLLNTNPYLLKAFLLNKLNRAKEAYDITKFVQEEMHVKTAKNNVTFGWIHTSLARSELNMSKPNEALQNINKAIHILLTDKIRHPNYRDKDSWWKKASDRFLAEALVVKGDILKSQGDIGRALICYKRAEMNYSNVIGVRNKHSIFQYKDLEREIIELSRETKPSE
ncbi:hypothetical protein [Rickettsia endosymbiont of Cardiosporidium cionae]|uniref:hypothetical protein n=1 Tax=Rickettsia endosymbiont of Cardiosporidium cionae TaxID=2777155 RepID=UPI001893B53D|nr:hypothetical protein [Rickettsia endosymbiont of Cardiosporidium cionae]